MKSTRMAKWLSLLVFVLLLLKAEGISVGITYVQSAVAKGAGEDFLLYLVIDITAVCSLYLQHHCF